MITIQKTNTSASQPASALGSTTLFISFSHVHRLFIDRYVKEAKVSQNIITDPRKSCSYGPTKGRKAQRLRGLRFVPLTSPIPISQLTASVSPYSWFGFTNTIKYRPLLNAHGVSVDIIPFFLGGARESVGNPWTPTPKWKEDFSKQDSETTGRLLGLKIVPPKDFPILSLFVSASGLVWSVEV